MSAYALAMKHQGKHEVAGFAAKMIGIGLFAGTTMVYCQFLIDACFRGLR